MVAFHCLVFDWQNCQAVGQEQVTCAVTVTWIGGEMRKKKKTPALAMSHTELDHMPALLGYILVENWEMTYVAQS